MHPEHPDEKIPAQTGVRSLHPALLEFWRIFRYEERRIRKAELSQADRALKFQYLDLWAKEELANINMLIDMEEAKVADEAWFREHPL